MDFICNFFKWTDGLYIHFTFEDIKAIYKHMKEY